MPGMPLLWLSATELAKRKPESWVSLLVLGFTMSARKPGSSSCSCVSTLPILAPYPPHSPTPVSLPACVASMTPGDLVSGVGHPICLCPESLTWGLSLDKEHEAVAPWGSEGHSPGRAETQGALTPPALPALLPSQHWRTVRHPPDIPHRGPWTHFKGEHPQPVTATSK